MLAGKKWRNIENIRGKRGGEKLKNAEMRGINNNIRCFEMLNLKDLAQLSRMINNNIRCFEMQCTKLRAQKQQRINNNIRCFEIYE